MFWQQVCLDGVPHSDPPARDKLLGLEVVPIHVLVVGGLFATIGMGALRFHSRLFAWQRGTKRMGLRVSSVTDILMRSVGWCLIRPSM